MSTCLRNTIKREREGRRKGWREGGREGGKKERGREREIRIIVSNLKLIKN